MEKRFLVGQHARGLCIPCIWKVDTDRSSFPSLCWCASSPNASAWQVFCGPPLLHKNLLFETEGIDTETRNMHWAEHLRGLTEGCDATWHLACCIQTCIYPHFFRELWGKCPCSCLGAYCQIPFHTSHDLKGRTPVPNRIHSEGQNCRPTSSLWQIVDVLGRTNNQNHQFKHYMLRVARHFGAEH